MEILGLSSLLMHYKNPEIQKLIVEHSVNKEVAVKFGEKGFGKRPDTIQYASDVMELAKQGATSFHVSEELWKNPLSLDTSMRKQDLEDLRMGWDLVIDIDCKWLDYSGIAADLIVKALRHHGISSLSVKFSGNHGFHIGVPFEAFPQRVHGVETRCLFPDAPRKIAFYLEMMIKKHLAKEILKREDINKIITKTEKKFNELIINGEFDPFTILDLDTLLISSRHLYRMPYCFNEKSGLISIPIDPDKILEFNKEDARPGNIKASKFVFLDRTDIRQNEAEKLIIQAFDFAAKKEKDKLLGNEDDPNNKKKVFDDLEEIQKAIPEEFFPPCIQLGMKGIEDGRKRFLFTLVNFLTSAGWDYDKIEAKLKEWNKNNREALREVSLVGQLRYHKMQKKKILPPNCANHNYYRDIGICKPDNLCGMVKNPINYAKRKVYFFNKDQEEEAKKANKKAAKSKKKGRKEEVEEAKEEKTENQTNESAEKNTDSENPIQIQP